MENEEKNYRFEWETINDDLIEEVLKGEKIVQVSKEVDYLGDMEEQNKRIVEGLSIKYPSRDFRVSRWYPHEFGSYQEVEERVKYEVEDEEEEEDGYLW